MGVRGTDFYITERGQDETTEVSILRGAVQVQPQGPKAKPITLETGYSAAIPVSKTEIKKQETAPIVEVRKTTQEQLHSIQKASSIPPSTVPQAPPSSEVQQEVQRLETKASQTVLADIQKTDPKLYANVTAKPKMTLEELNRASVLKVMETAPKAPARTKPTLDELEKSNDDIYEKYFKPQDE